MMLLYRIRFGINRLLFLFRKSKPGFSLLMITHNRSAFLKIALEAIIKNTSGPFEIIVLDNASTDETENLVQQTKLQFPEATIVYLKKNFNYGTNGYALAFLQSKYEYVVDLDDDILAIQKNWNENVANAFEDIDQLAFLALDVIQDQYTEGAKPEMHNYQKHSQKNTAIQLGPTGGWFAVTSRKLYYRLGGFIFLPNKPFRLEDGDFVRKAKKRGLICAILSDTYVYHASGPIWNAKGKYHKVWKEKYGVDFSKETVNMVDEVKADQLPNFDVPQKAIDRMNALKSIA
jgi:glycosyltransferase involved in cell wall biosynthesis